MNQREFDHLLGLPPSTVGLGASMLSAAPDSPHAGFGENYPNTRSQIGLSQHNLAAFNSLFQSHDDALAKDVPAKPESSCHTTGTNSSRPQFVPPKGPRKQHRTGFRQLPGANGVVKRGRPSKNEYKLAGVEVDMYALKGVTLNGPAKSLAEVKGGEVVAKRAISRGSHERSRAQKPKSSASTAARAKSGSGLSQAIQEEALVPEEATMMPSQSYRDSQDMLFSAAQGSSAYNYDQDLCEPNIENSTQSSVFQSLNDQIASLFNTEYNNGITPQYNFGYSQWDPSMMADPGFEPLNDPQSLAGLQEFANLQQQSSHLPALNPPQSSSPQPDPNLDPRLNCPSLSLPWQEQLYANPTFGLDGSLPNPNSQTTDYNEYACPSVFQNLPL